VVAIAARRAFSGPFTYDSDCTPLPAPTTPGFGVPVVSDSSFGAVNRSLELRAQSSDREDLSWVIGASRMTQRIDVLADGVFPSGFGPDVPPGGRAGVNDATGTGPNDALFGQATRRVLDGRLGLTAGLRHERAERAGTNRTTPIGMPAFAAQLGSSRTMPKLDVDWRFDPLATSYANIATGWRPGGVNQYADTSTGGGRRPDPVTYGAARTRTVEAGVNLRRPAAQLEASAAVSATRVEDYQESVQTGTVTGFLANVPKVTIRGAEGELRGRPLPALQLNAGAGLARARYDEYGFAGDLLVGEPPANRPDWTIIWLGARWSSG
jgi:iron complex outermembrane receptor protein